MHPTDEEEDSGEESIVPRGPGWVDEHIRRPRSRTGPYSHQGSVVSNITDPHLAGKPSPIRIRSPALDNAPAKDSGYVEDLYLAAEEKARRNAKRESCWPTHVASSSPRREVEIRWGPTNDRPPRSVADTRHET